jgi:hypothetical protein
MPAPACHPERAYQAREMCGPCYQTWYTANKRKKRARKDPSEFAENYRKPPTRAARIPDCHPERPHVALGLCRACYQRDRPDRARAECHPERPVVANGMCGACNSRASYHESPEVHQERARRHGKARREKLRAELLAAYGGKCACKRCPETNPAFLTLEHVGGGGKQHREKVGSHSYADLRRRGFPQDSYTLLCWNCNAGSRFTRVCPHME